MADLVTFDDTNRARLLNPEKFSASETLQRESEDFLARTSALSTQLETFLAVLEQKGLAIEREKLLAIGFRNRVEGCADERRRAQKELETVLAERRARLERMTTEYESLVRVEQEQRMLLEKLLLDKA